MRRRRAFKQGKDNNNNNTREDASNEDNNNRRDNWCATSFENELLNKFYKDNIVPSSEWEQFITMLRHPLNTAVRLNPNSFFFLGNKNSETTQQAFSDTLLQQLQSTFENNNNNNNIQEETTANNQQQQQQPTTVRRLNFVPCAIDFTLPRGALKKNNIAGTSAAAAAADSSSNNNNNNSNNATTATATNRHAKAVLNTLSDHGFLSRQEVVSMVPPALLNVRPGHRVLDMCAAPGSKTMQMLEKLVAVDDNDSNNSSSTSNNCRSSEKGFVVANDVNAGRLDVLQKQIGRNQHASAHSIVTNFDARVFPTPLMKNPDYDPEAAAAAAAAAKNNNNSQDDASTSAEKSTATTQQQLRSTIPFIPARFDRVLCDAMCSGDGTLRKSADLWERWRPNNSLSLHNSQKNVLFRGLQLCKEGGIVVYSTCSMHPAEDEAVVAVVLKMAAEAGGKFELMDPREQLPNLKYCPGQRDWKIMQQNGSWVDEEHFMKYYKEKQENTNNTNNSNNAASDTHTNNNNANDDDDNNKKNSSSSFFYHPSLLPSMFPSFAAKDTPNLEYCCRVLPHQQDTGGFFISAMKCVKEMPTSTNNLKTAITNSSKNNNRQRNQKQNQKHQQSYGGRTKEDECFVPIPEEVKRELQLYLHLPVDFPFHRIYCRKKMAREPKFYYVSEDATKIIDQIAQSGSGKNLERIVSVGVRVFESLSKSNLRAARFALEGSSVISEHLPSCLIHDATAQEILDAIKEDDAEKKRADATVFAVTARLKMPQGWRTQAQEWTRAEHQKRQQQQATTDNNNNTTDAAAAATTTATSSTIPSYPQPLKQILVRIHLGKKVISTNNNTNNDSSSSSVLTLPGEMDIAGYVTIRMQRSALNLLRYSYDGFSGVLLEESAGDKRKSKQDGGDDNDDEDEDEDENEDDENCCQQQEDGPKAPPQPQN